MPSPNAMPYGFSFPRCSGFREAVALVAVCIGLVTAGCSHVRDPALDNPSLAVVGIEAMPSPVTRPTTQSRFTGRGFFVSSDGLLVTCRHLIRDRTRVTVVGVEDGRVMAGVVVQEDEANDLALVKVQVIGVPYLHLFAEDVTPGLHVRVVGRSGLSIGTFHQWDDYGRLMGLTALVGNGDAGSPVLADDGSVVGVVRGPTIEESTGRSAIPAWCVLRMMPLLRLRGTGQ